MTKRVHAARRHLPSAVALIAAITVLTPSGVRAQWSTTYDQFYLPGSFNWEFRRNYPAADRLFNAFDFGHAILYETLWTTPGAPVSELEEKWYDRLTKEILVRPPRVPLEEGAIEIAYAKLAPEAKQMFDWAHLLHRQIYDVWADESRSPAQKDAKVQELLRYYKSRPDLAFSSKPKTMELMEGQPYATAFRRGYPKFNGLIWAYHWLQIGLYEPLLLGKDKDERQTGVIAAVARFRQMIEDPPTWMPRVMPMSPAVAPTFTARYPEAAVIFDNLHSMHDVVSDILANPSVPRDRKRAEILLAARRYRDDTSFVMTEREWRDMAQMMGVENMGGPVTGFLASFPQPTVERGAVMAGMDHSRMPMGRDSGMAGMQHDAQHGARQMGQHRTDSAGHAMPCCARDSAGGHQTMHGMGEGRSADSSMDRHMAQMMELHLHMMRDPVIRQRMMADTAMRRMMRDMMKRMPPEHREHMEQMMREPPTSTPARRRPGTRAAPRRPAPATRPAAMPTDPHAGHHPTPTKSAPAKSAPARPPKTPPAKKDSVSNPDHGAMHKP